MMQSTITEVPEMVARLKNGDELAFSLLFRKFGGKVYATSRKMHLSHEDAEEIVQEVFLKIWRKKADLKDELSFNAYLIAILKSMIFKKAKKQARFLAYQKYAASFTDNAYNEGETELIYAELKRISCQMISGLPKSQKEVIEMKYLQHLSSEEISERLSISKRTVESHIYKATKKIKEKLIGSKVVPSDLFPVLFFFLID